MAVDQVVEGLLNPDFKEGVRVPVAAVQQVEHGVVLRRARVARGQVDQKRSSTAQLR